MNATGIVHDLAGQGISIGVDRGRLFLKPRGAVTPEIRAIVGEHKAVLLALIQGNERPSSALNPELAWRIDAMRLRLPSSPAPVPCLLARPDALRRPGCCLSCGDVLDPSFDRSICCAAAVCCRLCIHAAHAVLDGA